MKKFTLILMILALILVGFNAYHLDFNNLLEGDSMYALIGIFASLCVVLILLIFRISKKIEERIKG